MLVPPRLSGLLSEDGDLEDEVGSSIASFKPLLQAGGSRPTFFPDYTDHSLTHIEEVLKTAEDLVADEAWDTLTSRDAAVLTLAALLHDAAMHLTVDGFRALVDPRRRQDEDGGGEEEGGGLRWSPIRQFDTLEWPQLWAEFCVEARRFGQRRLVDLFGDTQPVRIPGMDELTELDLDGRARRLIGEFIRRHHARLAHEIARFGVPGPTDEPIRLRLTGEREELGDLAGLVARSHGLPARACLPYLKERFGRRTNPRGVHAVFLIALLRVADYLQLQASRAPRDRLKVHRITSPYSQVEWQVHESVRDIGLDEDDRNAISVHASPDNVRAYLRLKEWLGGLQDEIDASSAVLGEIYSRQEGSMSRLDLKVHRVLSNLDDDAEFVHDVPYLRRHVAFTAAGADLLKLLVGPLYGNRPEIGVRELVQNAVDAVRELDDLRARDLVPATLELPDLDAEVRVALERDGEGAWWLEVADRGVGMSPSTVTGYFLRAGASLRNSDAWKERFTGEADHSRVLRSGRFGIGALAAFLLGNELEVETRHADAPEGEGLRFTATVETDPIEIRRHRRPVGTTIRIRLHPAAAAELLKALDPETQRTLGVVGGEQEDLWDWFSLEAPRVVRTVDGVDGALPRAHTLPDPGEEPLPPGWRRLKVDGYYDVQWTYNPAPRLSCNGIRVHDRRDREEMKFTGAGLPLAIPNVSVFDADGRLPLSLQRDRLTTPDFPFHGRLLDDVLKDYLATALRTAPGQPLTGGGDPLWYAGLMHPAVEAGLQIWGKELGHWGSAAGGVVPCQGHALWQLAPRAVLLVPTIVDPLHQAASFAPTLTVPDGVVVLSVPFETTLAPQELEARWATNLDLATYKVLALARLALGEAPREHVGRSIAEAFTVRGAHVLLPRDFPREKSQTRTALAKWPADGQPHPEGEAAGFERFHLGAGAPDPVADELAVREPVAPVIELCVERRPEAPAMSGLARVWSETLGAPAIPFGAEERRRALAPAYETLRPYLEALALEEPPA